MKIELSIVMPCLNEAETLERCIQKARSFLDRNNVAGEIIVGDNGSTDGSQEIARRCGAVVVDVPFRGYGAALGGAIAAARGKYCIMGDSDCSYNFGDLQPFLDRLRSGADLVVGNRFLGGIASGAMPWKNRFIGNPILSGLGRFLFKTKIRDFHCGLRGLSKGAFERMDLRTTGMEFASEMVIKATLMKMNVVEVPTTLSPDGRSRPPHLRPFRDGWRHLRFMLLYSPNWLFLYPGLALMVAGLAFGGALLSHSVDVAGVRFSVGSLLYCATMIEIGFQATLFAVMSRTFAAREGLIPQPARPNLFDRVFTLERGVTVGILALAVGAWLLLGALEYWAHAQFGDLDVERLARTVIASCLTLSLGFEITLSSLLLSILKLNTRMHFETVPPFASTAPDVV